MKPYNDHLTSTTCVRLAFEDGFYVRWHHLMSNSITDRFNNTSITVDDDFHHVTSEESFDQYFNETFDKYRQMHPAASERIHRRYSYSSGDCLGLFDLLTNDSEKHQSTMKCLTNVTVFFIAKEIFLDILNTYSLWDIAWLEISIFCFSKMTILFPIRSLGIHLALRVLPDISAFQYSSSKSHDNRFLADFSLIHQRLSGAGLLIYNERTCTSDDVIQLYEDLLLVNGSVRNQITQCVYEAPIFIKRSLSKQGLKLLQDRSITKILVIPRVTTTVNRNDLFMDRSLIQQILDNETKRDFNQKLKRRNRTGLTKKIDEKNRINDDSRHPQTKNNIHRFLLAKGSRL
jgi:hypothetical protein